MSKRTSIPSNLIDELLVRSKRRCALCYLSGKTQAQPGSFALLEALPGDEGATLDDLVYLCAQHHAEFDRQDPVRWSVSEVRKAQTRLYRAMEREESQLTSQRPRVFVVHGHDEYARVGVMRFLDKLGLEPISLDEQPAFGLTILEKFERNADVSYAVAVLTPDDERRRARQNVIFELGYLMGRLGRHNVCALVKPGVEILSDFQGLLYVPMDHQGDWRRALARELIAAGLPVAAPSS